ncbi:MAG: CarD family transcriptional regulator [Lachnospiraceae bacterium]|nr:CarD family transcriptional regulator [Lachnospiraceae bacterium]
MYKIGDLIVYENKGICRVDDITELNLPSAKKGQKYYVLKPVYEETGTIFSAVNNDKVHVRPMMSKEEAEELIKEIPDIPSMTIKDEKEREARYREAMLSCDSKQWVSAIKTLYTRRQNRLVQGKKTTNTDDRYYKMAGDNLHGELAMALGMEKSEMEQFITDKLESLGLVTVSET